MSTKLYDTKNAAEIAKVQGRLIGLQAGNATAAGVAAAPTSVYNQAGYYALQDTETGDITLKKLSNESLFTQSWYDQTTGTIFDFSEGGTGITQTRQTTDTTSTNTDELEGYIYDSSNYNSSSTTSSDVSADDTTADSTTASLTASSSSDNSYVTDEDGNVIELSKEDLQEMVDAGIYESLAQALEVTLGAGYYVSDETQSSLGIYSDSDEEKIGLMMENYGISRQDAIASLEGIIDDPDLAAQASKLQQELDEVQDEQGIIGKFWNGVKNLFNAGVSSEDCEYAIEQYKSGEITYDEASAVIDEYQSKQESATKGIKTGLTIAAGAIAGACTGGIGTALIAGGIAGAATKTAAGVIDNATNDIEGDAFDDAGHDLLTGAATGAVSGLAGSAVHKVAGSVLGKGAGAAAEAEAAGADTAANVAGKTASEAAGTAADVVAAGDEVIINEAGEIVQGATTATNAAAASSTPLLESAATSQLTLPGSTASEQLLLATSQTYDAAGVAAVEVPNQIVNGIVYAGSASGPGEIIDGIVYAGTVSGPGEIIDGIIYAGTTAV